jgi:hypothetical protein
LFGSIEAQRASCADPPCVKRTEFWKDRLCGPVGGRPLNCPEGEPCEPCGPVVGRLIRGPVGRLRGPAVGQPQ